MRAKRAQRTDGNQIVSVDQAVHTGKVAPLEGEGEQTLYRRLFFPRIDTDLPKNSAEANYFRERTNGSRARPAHADRCCFLQNLFAESAACGADVHVPKQDSPRPQAEPDALLCDEEAHGCPSTK